jgi:hypothetical protein
MNYRIIFNMPGKADLTQFLIISAPNRDQALLDAGYLAHCYKLEALAVEPMPIDNPGR